MRVCIVGANGYIGSVLCQQLENHEIIGIGKHTQSFISMPSFIQSFDIIIYLAGKTSRQMSEDDLHLNITPVVNLAKLMTLNQLLIYASTSAVAEGYIDATEDILCKMDSLDSYSRSMLQREKAMSQLNNVRTIGLRLATVVGISPKQRSDRIHIQMLKSALFTGRIHVYNPYCVRPIIEMNDTVKVFQCILDNFTNLPGGNHHIYNIGAFNTTVALISTSIALQTRAAIIYEDVPNVANLGFSIDSTKFKTDFKFEFTSNNENIIADLVENQSALLESWANPCVKLDCLVCANPSMIEMVDLGQQPLANHFVKSVDTPTKPYPLAMYRCLKCYHHQLSHIIPPSDLFSEYIYVSGTAKTNDEHFTTFADKVTQNIPVGKVLDIACNDGTQLDKFKSKGWTTYGVDPAKNLEPISKAKGHNIVVGFWGDPTITHQIPPSFDIILAQNVLAHVPNPKLFLLACINKMTSTTKLYIQTSQAEIFTNGEFDTIYHEHISFFTIKSMVYLSDLCGLQLFNVEKVPIHGVSYIFGLKLKDATNSIINIELDGDIYSPYNPIFYRSHVYEKRDIIRDMITHCKNDGFAIIGFGASAKGNTLLNFLNLSDKSKPEYIVDENPLKQGLYTPGTLIPVVSYDKLLSDPRPLAILILAWNFLEEIKAKILNARQFKLTLLLVPFPNTDVYISQPANEWTLMSSFPLRKSLVIKEKIETLLVTHFYNEEFLLPHWILQHAPMFDHVVLINDGSTDNSVKIIQTLAPKHWKIVDSGRDKFNAAFTDNHVVSIEDTYPDHIWKVCLTMTEFLVWPTIYEDLSKAATPALKLQTLNIIGDDSQPFVKHVPLIRQRNRHTKTGQDYSRYIHKHKTSARAVYSIGRHGTHLEQSPATNALILKYIYSPWPEIVPRKLQIAARQHQGDIDGRLGYQHQYNLEQLEKVRNEALQQLNSDYFRRGHHGDDITLNLKRSKILHQALQLPWSTAI